jgi:hypothetical protein
MSTSALFRLLLLYIYLPCEPTNVARTEIYKKLISNFYLSINTFFTMDEVQRGTMGETEELRQSNDPLPVTKRSRYVSRAW